jgi:hypothetical protein
VAGHGGVQRQGRRLQPNIMGLPANITVGLAYLRAGG